MSGDQIMKKRISKNVENTALCRHLTNTTYETEETQLSSHEQTSSHYGKSRRNPLFLSTLLLCYLIHRRVSIIPSSIPLCSPRVRVSVQEAPVPNNDVL